MKIEELLPIGSIVILKNAEKKLMIFGIAQTDMKTKETYDYMGVMYPEGSMGEGTHFLFNQSDIDKVFFQGYQDEERTEFIKNMSEFYEQNK